MFSVKGRGWVPMEEKQEVIYVYGGWNLEKMRGRTFGTSDTKYIFLYHKPHLSQVFQSWAIFSSYAVNFCLMFLTLEQCCDFDPILTTDLDLRAWGVLLCWPVAIILLLALQELTEMVLEKEGGVEFPHRHLIICNHTSHSAVSVRNTGLLCVCENETTLFMLINSPPIGGMTWSNSFMLVRFQICFIMALSSSLAFSKLPVQKNP